MRLRIVISGEVHGVGFRYHVHEIAPDFAVTGFVKNAPDGSVLIEAQGTEKELDVFISAVLENPPGRVERTEKTGGLPEVIGEKFFTIAR